MKQRWKADHHFEWSNWTLGFWWDRRYRVRRLSDLTIGVEFGPLQLMWYRTIR